MQYRDTVVAVRSCISALDFHLTHFTWTENNASQAYLALCTELETLLQAKVATQLAELRTLGLIAPGIAGLDELLQLQHAGRATLKAARTPTTCCRCSRSCCYEDFCYGCLNYLCEACGRDEAPIGQHTLQEHQCTN